MKASFQGKVYSHRMTADTQRRIAVCITALRMMQTHHGNPFYSFDCVSDRERDGWYAWAESFVPAVEDTPEDV